MVPINGTSSHHVAHAASAFHASPFSRAAVLTLDGRGEKATTMYLVGTPNDTITVFAPGSSSGVSATFDASGSASVVAGLEIGFNHVCAVVAKGDTGHAESQECVDVAYLP